MREPQRSRFGREHRDLILPLRLTKIIQLKTAKRVALVKLRRITVQAPADISCAVDVPIHVDIGVANNCVALGGSGCTGREFHRVPRGGWTTCLRGYSQQEFIKSLRPVAGGI